jgi:hypothetical protein
MTGAATADGSVIEAMNDDVLSMVDWRLAGGGCCRYRDRDERDRAQRDCQFLQFQFLHGQFFLLGIIACSSTEVEGHSFQSTKRAQTT